MRHSESFRGTKHHKVSILSLFSLPSELWIVFVCVRVWSIITFSIVFFFCFSAVFIQFVSSRPSVLQSPPKQSPFITVVATTPTPPPLVSASSAMSMVQQPSMAYASMIQQQTEGLPWKCPDWMATNASSTTDLVEFNSQSFGRMPFKRKAATAINP